MKSISKIVTGLLVGAAVASAAPTLSVNTQGDPFADMERIFQMQMQQMRAMQQQMDQLFQNFEKNFQTPSIMKMPILVHSSGILSSGFQDKGDHYELSIKVNDLKNSKVKISTENNMLTIEISENKKIEKQQGKYGKIISYSNSSSVQSFTLPPDADPTTVKAEQKGDTIVVTVAKKKAAKVIPIHKSAPAKTPSTPAPQTKPEKKTAQ
ncbi:Hsp20 family protein [Nitratifractor sp.]